MAIPAPYPHHPHPSNGGGRRAPTTPYGTMSMRAPQLFAAPPPLAPQPYYGQPVPMLGPYVTAGTLPPPTMGVAPSATMGAPTGGPVPRCRCRVMYLGSAVPHVTKDGLQGIQEPLRELYPDYESLMSGQAGIDSWLSVWSNGVLLQNIDDCGREVKRFFPIDTLHYCAAVRYGLVNNSNGNKPTSQTSKSLNGNRQKLTVNSGQQTANLSAHHSSGNESSNLSSSSTSSSVVSSSSEPLSSSSPSEPSSTTGASGEQQQRLSTSSTVTSAKQLQVNFLPLDWMAGNPSAASRSAGHPPVFACIMRRTTGIKVLECHAFICKRDAAANALVQCCFHAYADTMYAKQLGNDLKILAAQQSQTQLTHQHQRHNSAKLSGKSTPKSSKLNIDVDDDDCCSCSSSSSSLSSVSVSASARSCSSSTTPNAARQAKLTPPATSACNGNGNATGSASDIEITTTEDDDESTTITVHHNNQQRRQRVASQSSVAKSTKLKSLQHSPESIYSNSNHNNAHKQHNNTATIQSNRNCRPVSCASIASSYVFNGRHQQPATPNHNHNGANSTIRTTASYRGSMMLPSSVCLTLTRAQELTSGLMYAPPMFAPPTVPHPMIGALNHSLMSNYSNYQPMLMSPSHMTQQQQQRQLINHAPSGNSSTSQAMVPLSTMPPSMLLDSNYTNSTATHANTMRSSNKGNSSGNSDTSSSSKTSKRCDNECVSIPKHVVSAPPGFITATLNKKQSNSHNNSNSNNCKKNCVQKDPNPTIAHSDVCVTNKENVNVQYSSSTLGHRRSSMMMMMMGGTPSLPLLAGPPHMFMSGPPHMPPTMYATLDPATLGRQQQQPHYVQVDERILRSDNGKQWLREQQRLVNLLPPQLKGMPVVFGRPPAPTIGANTSGKQSQSATLKSKSKSNKSSSHSDNKKTKPTEGKKD